MTHLFSQFPYVIGHNVSPRHFLLLMLPFLSWSLLICIFPKWFMSACQVGFSPHLELLALWYGRAGWQEELACHRNRASNQQLLYSQVWFVCSAGHKRLSTAVSSYGRFSYTKFRLVFYHRVEGKSLGATSCSDITLVAAFLQSYVHDPLIGTWNSRTFSSCYLQTYEQWLWILVLESRRIWVWIPVLPQIYCKILGNL